MTAFIRIRRVLLLATVAALLMAPEAQSHGGTRASGYVSTVSALEPNVLGVTVNIFGGHNTISLSNYSGKTIVVLGRSGEPYLRFARGRVEENTRSPTTFLNRSRPVPVAAKPDAPPRWRQVANGTGYSWHDHRIVWTGTDPPLIVRQAPHVSHLVFRWALHATADGKPFLIKGFLGWAPPPKTTGGDTSAWVFAAGGGGIAALTALALGLWARRARRRAH